MTTPLHDPRGGEATFDKAALPSAKESPKLLNPEVAEVIAKVERFAARFLQELEIGSDLFWGTKALEQAAEALKEGNYGIGAVALRVTRDSIEAFYGRNRMVTGHPTFAAQFTEPIGRQLVATVFELYGHAEQDALIGLKAGSTPDLKLPRSAVTAMQNAREGIHVFGTLEACPMCACSMTNGGVIRNLSNALDPYGAYVSSSPESQPRVWKAIQDGRGMEFGITGPHDELQKLSEEVFLLTREAIDDALKQRGS